MTDTPLPARFTIADMPQGTTVADIGIGLDPDRGVLVIFEHDDYGLSADEARQVAQALLHYAERLDHLSQVEST